MLKVLLVPSDEFGCGFYRMIQPAHAIEAVMPNEVDMLLHHNPTADQVDSANLLIIQRTRMSKTPDGHIDMNLPILERAKSRGIPVIYEHDDNDYALPSHHGLYLQFRQSKMTEKIDFMLKEADYVTTTTPYLADVFAKRCGNRDKIYVFPNCINFADSCWNYPKSSSRRFRIGWAGGSSHARDLKILDGLAPDVVRAYGSKVQFMLGGYDTRGVYTYYEADGSAITRPIEEHETVWVDMAAHFFSGISPDVKRIMRTLPIEQYGFHFSQMDVGLVPLEDTDFTRAKSPLKLLELGAYRIPCIVSQVEPYTWMIGDRTDVVTFIPPGKGIRAWMDAITDLYEHPKKALEMGDALYKLVHRDYDALKQAHKRLEFWQDIVNGNVPRR